MAFLLYFVVILVSAASVMFGLDLMTSPLPSTPNVPIGRSAQVAPTHAAKPVRQAKRDADTRALSPVYPAHPDAPKAQAQSPQPQTNGSAAAGAETPTQSQPVPNRPPEQQAFAPPQQQKTTASSASGQPAPAAAESAQSAASQPAVDENAEPPPAVAQGKARCDVQACAAAYHSFRASDCSYQPYPGVRQVCTRSGGAASAAVRPSSKGAYAARRLSPPLTARAASDNHELDEVTRIVRKMTRGRDGDVAVQDSQGRIIIVRPGNARAYAPYD